MTFLTRSSRRHRSGWRKLLDISAALLVMAAVAFTAARMHRFAAADLSGQVRVIDGDSLALGERRLRLKGIDAPEIKQRCRKHGHEYGCGVDSASHLRGLIGRHPVTCRSEGIDRYRRDLVRCSADGVDLNAAMVRSGHAIAFGDYELIEAEARLEGAGLWAGEFQQPKQWRAIHGGVYEEYHAGLSMLMAFLRRLFGI
jgi:endonuclease YncB( thermonuclease family)